MAVEIITADSYLHRDKKEQKMIERLEEIERSEGKSQNYQSVLQEFVELQEGNRGVFFDEEGKRRVDSVKAADYVLMRSAMFCVGMNQYFAYDYKRHCYDVINSRTLRKMIITILDEYMEGFTKGIIGSIASSISDRIDEHRKLEETKGIVVFQNGTLNLNLDSDRKMEFFPKFSSKNIVLHSLPYKYDPDAKCPRFLQTVSEWMNGDEELIALFRDCCANVFAFGEAYWHQIVFLYGEGRNGKSVMIELFNYLFPDMVSHSTLSQWTKRFGTYEMVGKVLNISSENKAEIWNTELIKQVSAGDTIQVEQKFKDGISVRITAKLMVATNDIPKFTDKSLGWAERFIIIPFERTFAKKAYRELKDGETAPNPRLLQKLMEEREGIVAWLLEGLEDLKNRDWKPMYSKKAEMLRQKVLMEAQPVLLFAKSCIIKCAETEKKKIQTAEVHKAFKEWADYNNISTSKFGGNREFHKEFRDVLKKMKCNPRTPKIKGDNYYLGIKLAEGFMKRVSYEE